MSRKFTVRCPQRDQVAAWRPVTAQGNGRFQASPCGNFGRKLNQYRILRENVSCLPVSIIPPLLHTHSFIYHPRCIMFLSQYFRFPPSVSFHHCSTLILIYKTIANRKKMGDAWESSNRSDSSLDIGQHHERKVLSLLCFSIHTKRVFYNSGRLAAPEHRIIPLYPTNYKALQVNWCGKMLSGPLRLPQLSRSVNETVCVLLHGLIPPFIEDTQN